MGGVIRGKQTVSQAAAIGAGLSTIDFAEPLLPVGFSLGAESAAFPGAPAPYTLTRDEIQSFLRVIARSLHVKRHYELFQLMQGEVQDFIPHRILVSAWGDFGSADLKIDVISPIPGVRTNRPSSCDIEKLLHALHVRWLAHGRQPLLLHKTLGDLLGESSCTCTVHNAMHGMAAALVHGNHNVRDGTDSLYLALNTGPISKSGVGVVRFQLLADLIISQLDTAFRKVSALKRHSETAARSAPQRGGLSLREVEIIDWVAKGRTNAEISSILAISEYTVKNHVRRIMKKLGAANRTEAVAKFRCDVRDPRARGRSPTVSPAADHG